LENALVSTGVLRWQCARSIPWGGVPRESRAEVDECRPQTGMHVRNLALNSLADEDVGTLANRLRSAVDLVAIQTEENEISTNTQSCGQRRSRTAVYAP
jgi:hypothetical protein